jgi:hypothetical protein
MATAEVASGKSDRLGSPDAIGIALRFAAGVTVGVVGGTTAAAAWGRRPRRFRGVEGPSSAGGGDALAPRFLGTISLVLFSFRNTTRCISNSK